MLSLDLKHQKFLGPALVKHLAVGTRSNSEIVFSCFSITLQDLTDFMESQVEATRPSTLGGATCVQALARRSITQCGPWVEGTNFHPSEGAVADSEVPEELHKGRKIATTGGKSFKRSSV